jgi:two-component system sensor kinase FixL
MFGYSQSEMVGHNVCMLMPAPYKQQHNGYLNRYKQTNKAYVIGQIRRLEGEHKKGFTFSIELRVSRVDSPGGTTYVGIIHKLIEEDQTGMVTANSQGKIISANKILVSDFLKRNNLYLTFIIHYLMIRYNILTMIA